jgi:2-dehydro-3-deoxyphosphogluconate aldolase/(4S)-4-hydroxy-2-oxoglutarate aldolase
MARFDRLKVYNTIIEDGLVPLFYNRDKEKAKLIAKSLIEGGSRVLEFTNRGDFAIKVLSDLLEDSLNLFPNLIIGVGSVIDAPTAALYIAHGANFIVGPSLNEEISRLCNRRKIAYIPGCGSVNEVSRAEELGAEIVKVFPGSTVGGPEFVKALLGPMPWTKVMPTGGVTTDEENIKEWFKAGVACIGMGSNLVSSKLVEEGNYNEISAITERVLKIIKNIRGF